MVDSIEFRSIDWDDVIELTGAIIQNDEQAIELPMSFYWGMVRFAESQEENNSMITILDGNEKSDIYIVDFPSDPHNYGVFIGYESTQPQFYLTTGIAATKYLIELCYKGAINAKSAGRLLVQAQGASAYIDADIEYPDIGAVRTRMKQDLE